MTFVTSDASQPSGRVVSPSIVANREFVGRQAQRDTFAGAGITRKHAQATRSHAVQFGEVAAELFQCESRRQNELEVFADNHILLMRHAGVSSRCEIDWIDHGERRRLSEIREHSILFNPAFSRVRVCKHDQGNYAHIALQIPPTAVESLGDDLSAALRIALPPQAGTAQPELSRVVTAIRREMQNPGLAGSLYRETLGLQLTIGLLRSPSSLAVAPAPGGLARWQLRRVIDMMEDDLASTPSLAQLAACAGLSQTHFSRAFKQSTGVPPHRYMLNRRIAHAKSLMANPALSLTEIALDSGFGSSSRFATMFRRIDGRSPSEFRRNHGSL